MTRAACGAAAGRGGPASAEPQVQLDDLLDHLDPAERLLQGLPLHRSQPGGVDKVVKVFEYTD